MEQFFEDAMAEEIKWFYLRKKNSELVLGRINTFTNNGSFSGSKLELITPTFPDGKRFCGIIGCFEDEMKLEYVNEIEKFDLEIVELMDE
jgi:hypothetical protein